MGLLGKIDEISRIINGAFGALLMILCIAGIFGLAVLLTVKKSFNKPAAVISQAIGTALLMMPVMWGLNNYAESNAGRIEQPINAKNKIREQERIIIALENQVRQLESSGFNLQEFNSILKLGLIETQLSQTILDRRIFDRTHRGILTVTNYDREYLGVLTSSLTARFGVDLKLIKLYYSEDNSSIVVCGVKPEFQGTQNYDHNVEVSEVRKIFFKGNPAADLLYQFFLDPNVVTGVQIDNTSEGKDALREQQNLMEKNYRNRLNQGLQTGFMDETVVKLAENFIKMILAPLNKKVLFTNTDNPDALDMASFLENEKNKKMLELDQLKAELVSAN